MIANYNADPLLSEVLNATKAIVPDGCIAEALRVSTCKGSIFSEEAVLVDGAVAKRKSEFKAGRLCAHKALARYGCSVEPVLIAERGQPAWPKGIVGSITHDRDLCLTVLGSKNEKCGIGIDITENAGLDRDVVTLICNTREIQDAGRNGSSLGYDPFRVVFSVKESIYKCLFPLVKEIFDFHDVEVDIDYVRCRANIELTDRPFFDRLDTRPQGRFAVLNGHVISVVWMDSLQEDHGNARIGENA